MRFASVVAYLALALISLVFASNLNDIVALVFSAGGGSTTVSAAWLGLVAQAFRLWFLASFVEYLFVTFRPTSPVAALTYRATNVTELWTPNRAWIWGLLAAEANYERGFNAALLAGLGIQGLFLVMERRFGKGRALWHRLPGFFAGVVTLAILLVSMLFIRLANLEHALQMGRSLMGLNALDETALLLSAQLNIDFNVLLMLASIVIVFVIPPLLPLVPRAGRWKLTPSLIIVVAFVLIQLSSALGSYAQHWLANGLGKGNHSVMPGQYGWLFDSRELQALTGIGPLERDVTRRGTPSSKAKDEILAFARGLKERGIPLLLIPIPMKASIYPEALTHSDLDDSEAPLYHPAQPALYEQFAKEGIDVQDITAALMQLKARHKEVFLTQDSHWTPEAMQEIAKAIAAHVRKKYPGLVPNDPLIEKTTVPDASSVGDLAARLYRAPELVVGEEAKMLVSFPDLQVDAKSPISLLGDDFVRIFDDPRLGFASGEASHASFAQHLALYLGTRIDAITANQGAATEVRKAFASRFDDEVRAKKLVIWMVPARDLLLSAGWGSAPFNPQSSPPQSLEPMTPNAR